MKLKEKNNLVMKKERKVFPKSQIFEKGTYFLLSLVFATGSVMGMGSPFAIAFISVCSKSNFIFSAVGAVLGYMLCLGKQEFLRYAAACLITSLGVFALKSACVKNTLPFSFAVSFVASLSTGAVITLVNGGDISQYAIITAESLLCGASTFFFKKAINVYERGVRISSLTLVDLSCCIISFSFFVCSLARINHFSITLGGIAASYVIISSIRYGNLKWALLLSLSLGFSLGITGENMVFLSGAYGFSALLSSMFLQFGIISSSFAFVFSVLFFSVASGGNYFICVESILGIILFLLTPVSLCEKMEDFFSNEKISPEGSLRQSLVVKLRFASSAMASVSQSVECVSAKIKELSKNEMRNGREEYSSRELIAKELIDEKTNQIRLVASEQFYSIADMLFDLSSEFDEAETFDSFLAGKIRSMLSSNEISAESISVITDKNLHCRVEIQTDSKNNMVTHPKIKKEIEKICRKTFENGRVLSSGKEMLVSFSQKPTYKMEIGFAQHTATGGLCGDTVKLLNDSKGRQILILSDGMGTGGRAALDGAMASGLLSKLVSAGFGFDSSLKVVNSALLVKSNEESLATLDIASVDLFTGRCEFYKAGAAVSYIIKKSVVQKVELSSMPAGILKGIDFAKRTAVLSPGDTVVLMSDGVCSDGDDWLDYYFEFSERMTPQQTAESIVSNALKRLGGERADDMSVIVARLENN